MLGEELKPLSDSAAPVHLQAEAVLNRLARLAKDTGAVYQTQTLTIKMSEHARPPDFHHHARF